MKLQVYFHDFKRLILKIATFIEVFKIFLRLIRLQRQMDTTINIINLTTETQNNIQEVIEAEQGRLRNFIRQRVPTEEDAEDILQDVFYQYISGYETLQRLEKTTAWLFRVARNRITDWFRKKKPVNFSAIPVGNDEDDEAMSLEDILPDLSNVPDRQLFQNAIMEAIQEALDELPDTQRDVFVMHEFDDLSFKQISERTGLSVNTLLSRKRYAVLHLRERLQDLYNELFY